MAWALPETDSDATWPVEPDSGFVDHVLRSAKGVSRLAPFWTEVASRLTADDILLTAGQYTMTPDHRPLIGPAPLTSGLFLHTGYSGHGIMGAPAGARLLADLMAGVGNTANPFSPARFDGDLTPPDIEKVVI
jgi:sarcosine oxidase subunit beta